MSTAFSGFSSWDSVAEAVMLGYVSFELAVVAVHMSGESWVDLGPLWIYIDCHFGKVIYERCLTSYSPGPRLTWLLLQMLRLLGHLRLLNFREVYFER